MPSHTLTGGSVPKMQVDIAERPGPLFVVERRKQTPFFYLNPRNPKLYQHPKLSDRGGAGNSLLPWFRLSCVSPEQAV